MTLFKAENKKQKKRDFYGLQTPSSGSYELMGIKNDSADILKARRKMGAVVESPAIYKDLTARNNLIQQCIMLGLADLKNVDELLDIFWLSDTFNYGTISTFLIFASTLITTTSDYSDGCIRNKIISGASRVNIYLSGALS